MRKYIFALLAVAASTVSAEELTYSGNIAASCTFSGTAAGVLVADSDNLTITADAASGGTAATTQVTNNSPSTFLLQVDKPVFTAPGGMVEDGDSTVTATLTGANSAAQINGGVESVSATLDVAGTDSLSVAVSQLYTAALASGSYSATVQATCISL